MAELADHHPADALYAALLTALLDAAARLDTDASRLDTGREQTTDLRLLEEQAQLFREWLERAVMRGSSAGDHAKAQAFAVCTAPSGSGPAWPR
jgi:type VI protein secretion system component VasF